MVGLCKAFFALQLHLAWADWGTVQEWYGRFWRLHEPTGYWAETTEAGLLMYNEDHDWLEGWAMTHHHQSWSPIPAASHQGQGSTALPGLGPQLGWPAKRPRLPSIHERDEWLGWWKGQHRPTTKTTYTTRLRRNGGGGGPAAPDKLLEALGQVSEMLNQEQPEKRYEKKGFRACVRRQSKSCATGTSSGTHHGLMALTSL